MGNPTQTSQTSGIPADQQLTPEYLKGVDRIIGLVCYLTDAGVVAGLIDRHIQLEFQHHSTSGNEDYAKGVAEACREYFGSRRKTG